MTDPSSSPEASTRLRVATVLRVREDSSELWTDNRLVGARYATHFPSPRTQRLSPGHLVATAEASDGVDVVVWRWYDAVVLHEAGGLVRMWEPAHGEVSARPREAHRHLQPGTRAYVSAGLPGAEWWVAGPTTSRPEEVDVELGEVEDLYTTRDLWGTVV
jgi:hypothetical protein